LIEDLGDDFDGHQLEGRIGRVQQLQQVVQVLLRGSPAPASTAATAMHDCPTKAREQQ